MISILLITSLEGASKGLCFRDIICLISDHVFFSVINILTETLIIVLPFA